MLDVRVTRFRPEHYAEALAAAGAATNLRHARPLDVGRLYARYGPAYTIWWGNQVAACMGVMIPWDGLGDAWALWTPIGLRHYRGVHRVVGPELARIRDRYHLRRLQADVVADHAAGRRWLEHLGLRFEG